MIILRSRSITLIAAILAAWIMLRATVHLVATLVPPPAAVPGLPPLLEPLAPRWTPLLDPARMGMMSSDRPRAATSPKPAAVAVAQHSIAPSSLLVVTDDAALSRATRLDLLLMARWIDPAGSAGGVAQRAARRGIIHSLHRVVQLQGGGSAMHDGAAGASVWTSAWLDPAYGYAARTDRGARPGGAPAPARWSADLIAFFRDGSGTASLAGGQDSGRPPTLGGTQQVLIVRYRPAGDDRLAGFARATRSGRSSALDDLSFGVSVQPVRTIPVRLVAEQRLRVAGTGRSATALYATGGTSGAVGGTGWQFDSYGAAGVVGVNDPDLFAEASARLTRRIGRVGAVNVAAGAGGWAAAQPGVARVDIGPTLTVRTPGPAHVAVDWRQRVAGQGTPASGPAMTVGLQF